MSALYKYEADSLEQELATLQIADDTALAMLCANTAKRAKDAYLEFGPYWWAVKRILSDQGYSLGPTENALMVGLYNIPDRPDRTLIAAWRAADEIRGSFFKGSRDFQLDTDTEDVFSLYDPDMEA